MKNDNGIKFMYLEITMMITDLDYNFYFCFMKFFDGLFCSGFILEIITNWLHFHGRLADNFSICSHYPNFMCVVVVCNIPSSLVHLYSI